MLRVFYIGFLIFCLSCSSNSDEENFKIKQLNEELVDLKETIQKDDSTLNYFVDYANQIHDNFDLITSKQKDILIKIKNDPSLLSKKDSNFNNEIKELSLLIEKNNTDLEDFKSSFKSSPIEGNNIGKLIDITTVDMDDKNKEIVDLQSQLEAVDVAIEDLFSVFGETLAELDETKHSLYQTKNYLNTVWYTFDTRKGLQDKGIISLEGGFIGIGTNESLKGEFDITHFKKGNKNSLRKIDLPKEYKKYDLVTSHPDDSYQIKNSVLLILNPNDFWSISKYLVISLK